MAVIELQRTRPSPRTAFVLGGGGNLGAVQIGMLRAVLERDLVPDVLVGCSVGAINAVAIAARPSLEGVQRLEEIWLDLHGDEIVAPGHLTGFRLLARRGPAMQSNDGLRRLIDRCLPFRTFEEACVPLHVVATSLRTGRERWFSTGPVMEPILASAALPAVFPPVAIGGELFIDGAVVDNVPLAKALRLGSERVVVFHVGNFDRPRPTPRRPLDVLLQAFSIARSHRFLNEAAEVPDHVEVLTIPAIDPGTLRYNDFSKSRQMIARAYGVAASFLDARDRAASGA